MASRSHNSSPAASPSTSSDVPSVSITPPSLITPLAPLSMARAPSSEPQGGHTAHPHRSAVDLPRQQIAGRGGCWCVLSPLFLSRFTLLTLITPRRTCRLRRKVSMTRISEFYEHPSYPPLFFFLFPNHYGRNVTNNVKAIRAKLASG
jgi:hypothetical protein